MQESAPSFPSPEPKKVPLTKEAAQEEAELVEAKLNISPDSGKIPNEKRGEKDYSLYLHPDKEPTAEDYDSALAAVEELKNLVEKEPATEKVLNALGRIATHTSYGVSSAVDALTSFKPGPNGFTEFYTQLRDERLEALNDAAKQLRDLQSKAKAKTYH